MAGCTGNRNSGQTMAFLICRRAMCPLLKSLADRYTMSDNQPVKAGTGPDSARRRALPISVFGDGDRIRPPIAKRSAMPGSFSAVDNPKHDTSTKPDVYSELFVNFSSNGIFIPDSALPRRTKVDTLRERNLIEAAGQG
jgi:hypothetical protein